MDEVGWVRSWLCKDRTQSWGQENPSIGEERSEEERTAKHWVKRFQRWRGSRGEEGKAGFWSILDVQTQVFQERRVVLNANGKSSRKKLKKYPLNFIAFMSMWNKGSGPLMRDCVCESWYQGVGRMGVVIRVLQRNRTKNIYVITKERERGRETYKIWRVSW